ncbi:MAG: transglutaminase domain-containing protein, partial [Mariprofundaceae bacterium]|nr:transglutaminase domain-containing protein [Mariprofundaceae bacterium]
MLSKPFFNVVVLILSLLFWAWQIQILWLGTFLAVLLLLVFVLDKRVKVGRHSCHQIADLCFLIAAGIFAFYWLDNKTSKPLFPTLRLLPIAFFPLLFLQYLQQGQLLPRSTLLLIQRKSSDIPWIDMMPWFVLLCLFCAGAAEEKNIWYFPALATFILLLVFSQSFEQRLRQKGVLTLLFTLVAGLAFMLQLGLVELQQRVEMGMNQWLTSQFDQSQTSTAIGRVGRLKLSDDIVFRVQTRKPLTSPLLLQTGSYQSYIREQWLAGSWKDKDIVLNQQGWLLRPEKSGEQQKLHFLQSLAGKKKTLSIPLHSYRIQNLSANSVRIQQGGSVVVEPAQNFAMFDVWVGGQGDNLAEVSARDLRVPKQEAAAIALVAKALNLYQIMQENGEKAVLKTLRDYFWREYTYSTWIDEGQAEQSPLADFLLRTHSGHCEYFATATVLLLREVGIAARYAVGYSMQEWDADHHYYVVRGRDAHAWALVELGGSWLNVDHTPPDWFALEDKDRSAFQDFKDVWSAWMLKVEIWRNTESTDNTSLWLLVLLVLFSFLAWRILRRVQVQKQQNPDEIEHQQPSAWLMLEQVLI